MGSYTYELIKVETEYTRPMISQGCKNPSMETGGVCVWVAQILFSGDIDNLWLLGEGESVFLKCVALG